MGDSNTELFRTQYGLKESTRRAPDRAKGAKPGSWVSLCDTQSNNCHRVTSINMVLDPD